MNAREFFARALELEGGREPFALAAVVVRRSPVSSHLGDRAIVRADGTMEGYVGGACSRDIVIRHALDAMRTGHGRLLEIRSDAEPSSDSNSERIVVPMGCASEGAVDVYVEPHLPRIVLLVAGETPVSDALARIGEAMERFRVVRATSERAVRDALAGLSAVERASMAAVVATQGVFDEGSLAALFDGEMPAYVGLLASRKRAAAVFGALQQQGVDVGRLSAVHSPAGIDIGARLPSEVAVSILAEISCVLPDAAVSVAVSETGETHCCHHDRPLHS